MIVPNLVQGTPAWDAHRLTHFNASDAPAMMGCSPYKTREQLLQEMATGIVPEVDSRTQARFDEGHRIEALARPIAESILEQDLYPVVCAASGLSASMDGLTMDESIGFEHKTLNAELRSAIPDIGAVGMVAEGVTLPLQYRIQMEQQCMVSGAARILFMATAWQGEELIDSRQCWYERDEELARQILQGWAQFRQDLNEYKARPKAAPAPVADVIQALPALHVQLEGKVLSTNLSTFREAASAFIAKIKTDLSTDQDFANAAKTVKFCEDGEERLELVKQQALSQTATIDELFRTIDEIKEQLRQKRLALSKKVEARKTEIRAEIVEEAVLALQTHVGTLNARLNAAWVPLTLDDYFQPGARFSMAIKGLKTVDSVRAAVAQAVADAKIKASAMADRFDLNRKSLVIDGVDWFFLFADFNTLGQQAPETFSAIAAQRIAKHQADEKAREDAKAAAAAAAPPPAPVVAPAPAPVAARGRAVGDVAKPPITTGEVSKRLGMTINVEFLESLGIKPAPTPEGKNRGTYWAEADFQNICEAISAWVLLKGKEHAK